MRTDRLQFVSREYFIQNAGQHLLSEKPMRAVITARFDLGFYVRLSDGRSGQLRVPEMSSATADWDRSTDQRDGIGRPVNVYLVREIDDRCYFSEFSAEERSVRDEKRQDWIKAQIQAKVGQSLNVRIERKLEWGCICRQEAKPFLEGVIATPETVTKNQLPLHCATGPADWDALTEGVTVPVVVSYKQWAHWRYMLYFSLADKEDG